jgi:hypothetical protein
MDEPAHCETVAVSRIIDPPEQLSNILEVRQERDTVGESFQTMTLLFASSEYIPNETDIFLTLNDQRQISATWNGRMLGIGRPERVSNSEVVQRFCSSDVKFWRASVGFGTIAENRVSLDPGLSVVGRTLTEGQQIQIRLDVCTREVCQSGTTRTFQVHLIP